MEATQNFVNELCENNFAGVKERWLKLPVENYDTEVFEVIGGLMARQMTLCNQLAQAPAIWNGHMAPLVLRSMTDAHINIAWILKDPVERSRKYVWYGLGQEKLQVEHLEANVEESDDGDNDIELTIEAKKHWINNQRYDFMTEVNVGSWSGKSTRAMALEADCEKLYKFVYTTFSGVVHNMWQHVSVYNLKQCVNPLHKFHRVPEMLHLPPDFNYLYLACKYLHRSYESIDSKFELSIETKMPIDFFVDGHEALVETENSHRVQDPTDPPHGTPHNN